MITTNTGLGHCAAGRVKLQFAPVLRQMPYNEMRPVAMFRRVRKSEALRTTRD
jgi:hypothetical protein